MQGNSYKQKIMKLLLLITGMFVSSRLMAQDFVIYGFIPWKYYKENNKIIKARDINQQIYNNGMKPVKVLYHPQLLTSDNRVDTEKVKQVAFDSQKEPDIPVSFDIELGNRYKPDTKLPLLMEALSLYHKFNGKAAVGVYSVLPQNPVGGQRLLGEKGKAYQHKLTDLNKQYKVLSTQVDILSPVLYNYEGHDFEQWKLAAKYLMEQAKLYAKTQKIIPYIAPYITDSSNVPPSKKIVQLLSYKEMKQRLDYLKQQGANGVIIWSGSSRTDKDNQPLVFDASQGWAKAVKEFK